MATLEDRFVESLKKEAEEESKPKPRYFKVTPKFETGLKGLRGSFVELDIDKSNGQTRTLRGILCWSEKKARYLINESCEADASELRGFNHFKIKRIKMRDKEYLPKEN